MKFHVAVVQCNGEVTDRHEHTSARVRGTEVARQLVAGFGLMLEEQLPKVLDGAVSAQLPLFDDRRGQLEWRLAGPFSATAAFFISGKLKFTWFSFTGHDPAADAAAVQATEQFVNGLTADAKMNVAAFRLDALRERPLAVCVPWPPSASELEQRIVGNYAVCLADAYFDKVTEILRRGAALGTAWRERGRGRDFHWSDN